MKLLPLRLVFGSTTPPWFIAKQCHLAHPYFRGGSYQWHRGFSGGPNLGFRPLPPPHQFPEQNFRQFRSVRPQRAPDHRDWEFSKSDPPHNYTAQFKVLSYNLLAEYLAINHRGRLYFHIPRHILDWGWRKRSISFELGLWSADILCFQEVDRFQDLEEDLKLRGYSGTWKMRTGDPIDGCAIFWRVSRFRLLHEECIEYNELGLRDNVAQICVFELVNQNYGYSNSSGRSSSSNKVVICNIHVLYNPRRGEIKLGQVRVLLDRAHAVSKHWDNAPVVLCGDFNCTPKSPLYNYISGQKLDLSDLPRDEVSGQASAEIRPQWKFNPNVRPLQTADFKGDATQTSNSGEIGHLGSFNVHKERDSGFSVSCSPLTTEPKMCDSASGEEDCSTESVVSAHEERTLKAHHDVGYCENEAKSASFVSSTGLKERSISQERENLFDKNFKTANEPFSVNSSPEDILPSLTRETSYTNNCEDGNNGDLPKTFSEVSVSTESTPKVVLHVKMENLSLDGLDENNEGGNVGLGEDSAAFLAELHDGNDFVSNDVDSEPVNQVFNTYDPSAWTPMETESATGSSDRTLMEHSLKLKSSYTEVEDISNTRDPHGEPLVTSYNRCFLGTVDYIWRSEGLKTVRVLAPIPKRVMQWTPGFPTKKWGSDHIALVSELAFTNNSATRNT